MPNHENLSCHVCTVDLVGQGRLTTILTISISVIRSNRTMIIFVSHVHALLCSRGLIGVTKTRQRFKQGTLTFRYHLNHSRILSSLRLYGPCFI